MKKMKIGYGIGAVGKDMVYALVAGFLMYYYNTVLGVSSTFIGVLFMAVRIFDAFNDPMMGVLVGKTNTKLGKFRPWLLVGTLLNAVVLYFLFAVPVGIQGNDLLIYLSVIYLLWGITYTIMDIPYWSMIPAITKPGKERESVSVIARSCAGLGYALPTALTMLLVGILGAGNEREGFRILTLIIAILFVFAILVTVFTVKEKNDIHSKTSSVKEMFHSLFQNDQALAVVITIVIFNSSLYLTQNLALYFFEFDIGNVALYGVFATVGGIAQILSMMSLPMLRKKYETIEIFIGAISLAIIGYVFLFILGSLHITNIIALAIAAIIIFAGFGLATVLTTIFLADTVDYGEWKNNQRNESVVFSLQTFVVKLASAISVFIAGVGLDLISLDVNASMQSASTLLGMRVMMTLIPIVGLVIAIILFKKNYFLTQIKINEITNEIKLRKE
ncbi:glycoside-pentoside-hexuronide (GPH):cation symporter [Tannockella kyphosi]|uniref:glycoside-pentoside-hexuronide (GPH):cation symporter n=1 Tax=Tannockella kyphosi TaxID=2899121 RepID=UPI0020137D96|nr:glycoside-pentoside-hexuronide (GPH):cation symporter [Tannockella kyphosi]